jgi:hypothetical protein
LIRALSFQCSTTVRPRTNKPQVTSCSPDRRAYFRCLGAYSYPQSGAQPAFGGTTNRTVVVNTPMHGVDRPHDGVFIAGPGTLVVSIWQRFDGDLLPTLLGDAIQVHRRFGVATLDRRVKLDAERDCISGEARSRRAQWRLNEPMDDPWAEPEE